MLSPTAITAVEKLAQQMIRAQLAIDATTRPVDRKVARAEALGIHCAAYALGFSRSIEHIDNIVEHVRRMPEFGWLTKKNITKTQHNDWERFLVRELSNALITSRRISK